MITVKDIREKDFSLEKRGYSADEVDEFLDAIADQLGGLIRENREYLQRAEQAEQKLASLKSAPAAEQAKPVEEKPAVDETAYFENLKTALRETLLSAQRIADETVSEARKKADGIIFDADSYAGQVREKALAESRQMKEKLEEEVSGMKEQLQTLKGDMQYHKTKFLEMIKAQLKALGEAEAENPPAEAGFEKGKAEIEQNESEAE
ncbi:MAG: DivIVA domain-containing protein [Clostridia bacterium]|nr:DivIVA domain-containing protein [Clostridia bacterium]